MQYLTVKEGDVWVMKAHCHRLLRKQMSKEKVPVQSKSHCILLQQTVVGLFEFPSSQFYMILHQETANALRKKNSLIHSLDSTSSCATKTKLYQTALVASRSVRRVVECTDIIWRHQHYQTVLQVPIQLTPYSLHFLCQAVEMEWNRVPRSATRVLKRKWGELILGYSGDKDIQKLFLFCRPNFTCSITLNNSNREWIFVPRIYFLHHWKFSLQWLWSIMLLTMYVAWRTGNTSVSFWWVRC